jgi:hypothetical protein
MEEIMYGEPYDYFDEEETPSRGVDVVTPAIVQLEEQRKAFEHLKEYIRYYGAESAEVKSLIDLYKGELAQSYIRSAIRQISK